MNIDRDLVRSVAPPILAACVVALLLEAPAPAPQTPPPTQPAAAAER